MKHKTKPNSWVSVSDSATTQLTYALQLNPAPLTVTVPGEDPVLASLEFVVTNPTGSAIDVTSVSFTLQVGTTSDCITPTTSGIHAAVSDPTDWLVTGPGSVITGGAAMYTLGPVVGQSVSLAAGASVVMQLFQVQTNTIPGNSTIGVKSMIPGPEFSSFLVTTFPSGFYFNGLAATVGSGSNLVPVAQVNTGSTVTLTWNSSVVDTSAFTIYYSNALLGQQTATPADVGEWTSPALSCDTVFTVAVTTSVAGGQPLTASMTTVVSIQNPSLVAASILAGTANVTGNATIGGTTTANAITATGVNVNGAITANSATVNGALSADSIAVSGAVSANNITANSGNISSISTGYISTGSIVASNGASLTGYVSLCTAPDYSQGNVGIGGTSYNNTSLQITNNQSTGYGININAPNLSNNDGWWAFFANGTCANATGSWVQASDLRLKDHVEPFTDGLAQVLKINPVWFNYSEASGFGTTDDHVGVAAQDIQKIAPYMIGKMRLAPDKNAEFLSVDTGPFRYLLINAVKELHAKIVELQEEIAALKKEHRTKK